MAIVGRFLADFSGFVDEVVGAQRSLDDLKADADKTQTALDAVGKTTPASLQATARETREANAQFANMQTLLGEIGGIIGVSFSVGGIVALGREILETTGQIKRMADQTGLTTGQVQEFMYVASQTSTPIEAFTSAIQTLQQRIGSHDAGLVRAAQDLKISWRELEDASPYGAFMMVLDPLQQVTDKNRQMADGNDALGRSWRELAPAVREGMRPLMEQAPKLTQDQIDGWQRLEGALKSWYATFKTTVGAAWDTLSQPAEMGKTGFLGALATAIELWETGALPKFKKGIDELIEKVDKATGASALWDKALDAVGLKMDAAPLKIRATTGAVGALTPALEGMGAEFAKLPRLTDEETAALKKFQDAVDRVNSAGGTWASTLEDMDAELADAVRIALDLNVSHADIAATMGVSEKQIRAVEEAQKAYAEADKTSLAIGKDVLRQRAEQIKADENHAATLTRHAQVMTDGDRTTKAYYQNQVTQAQAAFDAVHEMEGEAGAEQRRITYNALVEAEGNLNTWQVLAQQAMDEIKGTADRTGAAIRDTGDAFTDAAQAAGSIWGPTGLGGSVVPDAMGSRNFSMNPHTELPNLLDPTSHFWSGMSYAVHVNSGAITMQYPIMNDPTALDQIGRLVGDAILNGVTRSGQRV